MFKGQECNGFALNRYLQESDNVDMADEKEVEHNDDTAASSSIEGSEDEKEVEDELSKLKETGDFITSGHHFDEFKHRLRTFLLPSPQHDPVPTLADDEPAPLANVSEDLNYDKAAALQFPVTPSVTANAVNEYSIQVLSFSNFKKIWNQLKRTWRPSLRLGHRRLEWICVSHSVVVLS